MYSTLNSNTPPGQYYLLFSHTEVAKAVQASCWHRLVVSHALPPAEFVEAMLSSGQSLPAGWPLRHVIFFSLFILLELAIHVAKRF